MKARLCQSSAQPAPCGEAPSRCQPHWGWHPSGLQAHGLNSRTPHSPQCKLAYGRQAARGQQCCTAPQVEAPYHAMHSCAWLGVTHHCRRRSTGWESCQSQPAQLPARQSTEARLLKADFLILPALAACTRQLMRPKGGLQAGWRPLCRADNEGGTDPPGLG